MIHLLAGLFFIAVLLGLAMLLEAIVRREWRAIGAALGGRHVPGAVTPRTAAVRVRSVRRQGLHGAA